MPSTPMKIKKRHPQQTLKNLTPIYTDDTDKKRIEQYPLCT
jgi:hypothetical protein